MQKNESGIPLSKALESPDYLNIMQEEDLPVLHINRKKHTHELTPFKTLYDRDPAFWQNGGDEEYFLTGHSLERLKKIIEERADTNLGSDYAAIAEMPMEKKLERISQDKLKLSELIATKSKDQIAIAEALATTTRDAAMINHTVLQEIVNFVDEEAKAFSRDMVIQTNDMVKTSAKLITENILNDELMKTITEKSNGIVFQHITRVYMNGVAFLAYLNKKISASSAVMKIRTSFNLKYRKFYQALLPHIDSYDLTIDHVFMEGLKVISPELLFKWSVGFLIHDLGKASDIEYHEGEAAYDRAKVVDHVKVGYSSILKKTNYPREAALMAGYHHEYYGDPDGYGPYRDDLAEHKRRIATKKQDYCISYELESILAFNTLAYFPAKVLEILDVYDSLTDPLRIYRRSMSSAEALDMMYKEFIIKRRKIDPILFDLFSSFVGEKATASAGGK